MKRPAVTRAVLLITVYWTGLLFASIFPFNSGLLEILLLPAMILGGLPLMALAAISLWRAANLPVTDLAFVDDLTGLNNRRAFTARATALLHNARPGSASLVLIDVDGLKRINDECGHLAGDELLEQVASHLCNTSSTVYRVGGDEFAILVDRSEGESVTGLMRSLTPLTHTFRTCGHEHLIQFSYGFASRREQEKFDELFSRADARLRQFKQRLYSSGRLHERRMSDLASRAEMKRVIAEAEADERIDEGTVVSIFSRSKTKNTPTKLSGTGD